MALAECYFRISGMTCDHCRQRVIGVMMETDGVEEVDVDLASGNTHISYQPALVSPEDLKQAVREAGYRVETV